MSYEMSFGYEFMGASESEKITESYSATLMNDVQTTYSADFSISHTLTCTAPEEGGVGFWQWKTKAFDGTSIVLTNHTLCRYGLDHYATPPACPWNACLDLECTQCTTDW